MGKQILIIDGHPDSRPERFVHALAHAYRDGARMADHEVRTIALGVLDFPLLRHAEEFQSALVPEAARACQESISWAEHLVILFPLWHGSLPALLKGFLEQVFRPGFAFGPAQPRHLPRKLLAGRSARLIVTLGMPEPLFRWYFRAHGLKSVQRSILEFCGIKPVRTTLVGSIEGIKPGSPCRVVAPGARARPVGEVEGGQARLSVATAVTTTPAVPIVAGDPTSVLQVRLNSHFMVALRSDLYNDLSRFNLCKRDAM